MNEETIDQVTPVETPEPETSLEAHDSVPTEAAEQPEETTEHEN